MSVKKNREVIIELLGGDGMDYHELGLDTFRFTDEGVRSMLRNCEVFCRAEPDLIQVYTYCPIRGGESRKDKILEFVARANYDLRVGNFEYDVRDGELRYKATLFTGEEETATPEQLRSVITAAVSTMHMYADGFAWLNYDAAATPKECIEVSEMRFGEWNEDREVENKTPDPDKENAERCSQFAYEKLLERLGLNEEDAPEEEEDED